MLHGDSLPRRSGSDFPFSKRFFGPHHERSVIVILLCARLVFAVLRRIITISVTAGTLITVGRC
jgi:hypothetical protein